MIHKTYINIHIDMYHKSLLLGNLTHNAVLTIQIIIVQQCDMVGVATIVVVEQPLNKRSSYIVPGGWLRQTTLLPVLLQTFMAKTFEFCSKINIL